MGWGATVEAVNTSSSGVTGMPAHRSLWLPRWLPLVACALVLVLGGCTDGSSGEDESGQADTTPSTTQPAESEPSTSSPATTTETTPDTTSTPPPPPPRPRVGECRRLRWPDTRRLVTDAGGKPARCGQATAQTFLVQRLPERTVDAAGGIDAVAVARSASTRCRSALIDWLGGGGEAYELSMFGFVVAVPPAADAAANARWYRCDAIVQARTGRLARLPQTVRGALDEDRGVRRWAACSEGRDRPKREQVLCSQPHRWRAVAAPRLGNRKDRFPGDGTVIATMRRQCEQAVRDVVADPSSGFDYGWLRPTASTWERGQRYGLCFTRDSGRTTKEPGD
jgi:hypothetical protein